MGLTKRDREFLTILHEARFIDGKLMRKYEQEVKKHLSFSDEELQGFIEKFLAEGLLTKIILKVDGDDVMPRTVE
tara:strand:+ start:383 stop:607 length:225 start_codon:yes stop_codon:yes gene_type:complete